MTDVVTSRYQTDTYFVQTRDALARLRIDADEFSFHRAVLLLKPDAAITGGMSRAVAWLREHRYGIVGAHPVALTPLHLRALWYFNWHRATAERRMLADQLAQLSPSLVLIVTHPDRDRPVSVRLTADKGPADPDQRVPGQLRYALSSGTYLLNQVHSPDDPDDVLRELSIYFSEVVLGEVISAAALGDDASADALRIAAEIESGVPRRSGDLAAAHADTWNRLQGSGAVPQPETGRHWIAAIEAADRHRIPLDTWYRIVLQSAYLPMHRAQPER
ncbi:nucleoside-diphosphate kinase [Mycolicibacterium sp. Y3]